MEGSIRKGYLFQGKRGIGVEPQGGASPYKHLLSTPPREFEMCAFIMNELDFPLEAGREEDWGQIKKLVPVC